MSLERSIASVPRTFLEWASQEIILPKGRFAGLPFSVDRQPVHGLLLQAYDNPAYRRIVVTGCVQSGKTTMAWVLPILYHLFEIGETVAAGIPNQDLAHDKWTEDILPVIEQTRYKDLIMDRGAGSRGGRFTAIRFRNGATLRFLSGSARDKSIQSYTTRILVATEVDGYDTVRAGSRETDKLSQMEGRLKSYGEHAREYIECTVSTEEGRIWQEFNASTGGEIEVPCPVCRQYIRLERDCLVGWEDAANEVAAYDLARWRCPKCSGIFDDDHRERALKKCKLVHRGQSVEDGVVVGEPPATFTLGFRWNSAHNLFTPAGYLASEMWRAKKSVDQETAERTLCQQFWAVPPPPPSIGEDILSVEDVQDKAVGWPRGLVPAWADVVTFGWDLGKHLFHWVVAAWSKDGTGLVIDYGIIETNARLLGDEQGFKTGFAHAADIVAVGWAREGTGEIVQASAGLVDSGRFNLEAYWACKKYSKTEAIGGAMLWPSKGHGASQERDRYYNQPKGTGSVVIGLGERYHWVKLAGHKGVVLCEYDADFAKSWIHSRLRTPDGTPGALRLFGSVHEHFQFSAHLTSEQEVIEKGIKRWKKIKDSNHYLDALSLAALAARVRGVKAVPTAQIQTEAPKPRVTEAEDVPAKARQGVVPKQYKEMRHSESRQTSRKTSRGTGHARRPLARRRY